METKGYGEHQVYDSEHLGDFGLANSITDVGGMTVVFSR